MTKFRPNVVVFITHDTGQHVSPYGIDTVHTPNCERLAREGVTFTRSFCTCPLCAPSRASLVTGRYPHQNGVMGLTGDPTGSFDLYATETHAAQHFADAGYESVLCGFEHETRDCTRVGFSRTFAGSGDWFNGGGDLLTYGDEIDQWLSQREAADDARPFYLQIGCHETHRVWTQDAPPDDSLGVWMPPYLADVDDLRREMPEFQGSIRRMDAGLGRILAALDNHGVTDDTIFVFTTDHGIDIPRAKGTHYDPGIEVFLFMRYPRTWQGNRRSDTLISNIDVLPTLLEACDIPVPGDVVGRSFLPLLAGDGGYTPNRYIFAEKTFHDTYDPTRAIRSDRYKYIRYFEVCIFQDLRLATMTQRHYWRDSWRRTSIEELYDLENDPLEMHNLADDPAYEKIKAELRRALVARMKETNDPLLNGPVASPRYSQALAELLAS